MSRCAIFAAALGVVVCGPGALSQVTLRGGEVLDDLVIEATGQGLRTEPRLGSGATRLLPWDMVRAVPDDKTEMLAPYAALAESSWRARWRVLRGDHGAAEPVLAELFSKLSAEDGPLTLRVAEGLTRCRLARGDQAGAVEPWLVALRLTGADAGLPVDPEASRAGRILAALIDAETGLCPMLPPFWPNTDRTAELARSLVSVGASGGAQNAGEAELRRWFARAAALDARAESLPEAGSSDAGSGGKGAAFVATLVKARDPDASVRRSARDRLLSELSADPDTWKEAWRRFALGRSYLMESSADDRAEGVVHMLHLPARFSAVQPYLSGLAAVEAAVELRSMDGPSRTAAEQIVADLTQREPFHPALRVLNAAPAGRPAGTQEGGR